MKKVLALVLLWLVSACSVTQHPGAPLKLFRVLPVEGPENCQPSGLTIRSDTLFTVSDKHDSAIYRVELSDTAAVLIPYLTFQIPDTASKTWFDFEGITHDDSGNFYIVSESRFRILRVSASREIAWITPNLKPYGENKELFQVFNAYLEGITWLGDNRFILAAEREPRGLLEVEFGNPNVSVSAYKFDEVKFPFGKGRSPDFADLFWYKDTLYALERNAFVVSQLTKENGLYRQEQGWSYGHIEHDENWLYRDTTYGLAEGLCMDDKFIYIVLDNNGDARRNNPRDTRPQLFVLQRPERY
jgi:hypothetical protein